MAKEIDVQKSKLKFPAVCVVCLSPATQMFDVEKIFSFGKIAYAVQVPVPMCELHYRFASEKSPAERLVGSLGLVAGLIVWAVSSGALLSYWWGTGQGNFLLNLFSAGILGFGLFLILWTAMAFWLAPYFAENDAKQARNAMRLKRYWPKDELVRLEFDNEQLAEMVERQSSGQ